LSLQAYTAENTAHAITNQKKTSNLQKNKEFLAEPGKTLMFGAGYFSSFYFFIFFQQNLKKL